MRLSLGEIADALNTEAGADLAVTGVCTDTRLLAQGDLFVALVSPKDDGHRYIEQAVRGGAAAVVASHAVDVAVPVLIAADTTLAYGRIARLWRDRFEIPVVGVTGSVGKTTTKEMIAAALTPLGEVLKTEASQNNETGVPKALLKLNQRHAAAVVEMGMRGAGQIAALCEIARPTVGVVTVVSDNHIELLGSLDAIADAKGELVAALPKSGTAVLNRDDPYYERLRRLSNGATISYGRSEAADRRITSERREDGGWVFEFGGATVRTGSPSRHDTSNAAAAMCVALHCGIEAAAAANALSRYTPAPMRMEVVETPWGGRVLNDSYNAAPASVKSALETLSSYKDGRRIAFLGDMKELGERSESAHHEVGDAIAHLGGLDALYTVGNLATAIGGASKQFPDSVEAAAFVDYEMTLRPGDTILVKGSRAMAMEKVVRALIERSSQESNVR